METQQSAAWHDRMVSMSGHTEMSTLETVKLFAFAN